MALDNEGNDKYKYKYSTISIHHGSALMPVANHSVRADCEPPSSWNKVPLVDIKTTTTKTTTTTNKHKKERQTTTPKRQQKQTISTGRRNSRMMLPRMLLLSFLCSTGNLARRVNAVLTSSATNSHCTLSIFKDIKLEDNHIPPHPADMMGVIGAEQGLVSTNIDIYQCLRDDVNNKDDSPLPEHWDEHENTLIIFAAGAPLYLPGTNATEPAGKEALTVFATKLAEQGFVTVMADKPNQLMGMSTFLPVDFLRVIQYMTQSTSGLGVENWKREFEAVVIGGHGFGGGMVGYTLTNVCPSVFCPAQPWPMILDDYMPADPIAANQGTHYHFNSEDLEVFDFVKAAFWYGGSAFQSMPPTEASGWQPTFVRDPSMTGDCSRDDVVPILMIYGTGEENILTSDRGMETYAHWTCPAKQNEAREQEQDYKAFLVLEGLDHNGMTDEPITFHENPIPSTLPVDTRASLVADSVMVWVDTVLLVEEDGDTSSSSDADRSYLNAFCRDVVEAVGEANVDLCIPASTPESSDDDGDSDDEANLGFQVGIPVGIFGALLFLSGMLYLSKSRQSRMSVSHHNDAAATTPAAALSGDKGKTKDDELAVPPDEEEGMFTNKNNSNNEQK
eukprot:scaffold6038_cov125-Amphora_coffeaeformis.AAC.1